MSELNYDTLKEQLKSNVLSVTFTKKNGDERNMICTLMADKIPAVEVKDGVEKKERAENRDVMAVYDTDADGWRSFRLDSVKNISVEG